MNTLLDSNLVHESEAQRQYARIRIPARIALKHEGRVIGLKVSDLSAGGFSLLVGDNSLRHQRSHEGRLEFDVNGFKLAMDVRFVIRNVTEDGRRLGCEFQDLGHEQIATLRHVITSYLSGELVSAGDVLNVLSRNNYTGPRKQKSGQALGFVGRARALTASLVMLVVGVGAFSWVAVQLWHAYFETEASWAVVSAPEVTVTLPRDGKVTPVVSSGDEVKAGQALATFESPLLSYADNLVGKGNFSVDQMQQMLGQTVKGTLTSPCDCRVLSVMQGKGQYLNKDHEVARLIPDHTPLQVNAAFSFEDGEKLQEGQTVHITLGNNQGIDGTISGLTAQSNSAGQAADHITAVIHPSEPLPMSGLGRPVQVYVPRWTFPELHDSRLAQLF